MRDRPRLTRRRFLQGAGIAGAAGAIATVPGIRYLGRDAAEAPAVVPGLVREAVAADDVARWSDPASWPDGRVPGAADVARVTQPILLDRAVAAVAGVHVEPGAALVFPAETTVTLETTGNVVVHGRLEIRPASASVLHTLRFAEVDESRFVGGDAGHVGVPVDRLGGAGRVETAALVSAATFAPGVPRVYVATGWNFPDALAAGALGGAAGGPVLLTAAEALPSATADELRRLAPDEVVVAGGLDAVSADVERALASAASAPVRRLAGADRYETAAALAADQYPQGAPVAFVATGANYPDALAGAPAAARLGGPLVLTRPDRLPQVTRDALAALAPERIVVLGGRVAVADRVLDELDALAGDGAERWSGDDRYATAVAVSQATHPDGAAVVYLATGENFPDALAGAPAALIGDAPLLLSRTGSLPDVVAAELARLCPERVVVLGGTSAVTGGAAGAAAAAAACGEAHEHGHADVPDTDVGLWVVGNGVLDIAGTPRAGWNRTGTDPSWGADDDVLVAPTAVGEYETFAPFTPGSSVPTVGDTPAEVMNLTRNVVITGTAGGRAHVLVRSFQPQTIRHALLRHMGPREFSSPGPSERPDMTGRYALHFHHCLDGSRGSLVEGVVVRDSGNHAFAPHASHGITFRDCIAYDVVEDAYWWDPPPEQLDPSNDTDDTVYEHCLAAKVRSSSHTSSPRQVELTGFYLVAGTGNVVRDCAAVGVVGGLNGSGFHWPSTANGLTPNSWVFVDCVAHNNARHGIFVWQNTPTVPHLIDRFVAYRNHTSGIHHGAYTTPGYHYRDVVLSDNGQAGLIQASQTGGGGRNDPGTNLTFERLVVSGSPHAAILAHHNLPTTRPTVYLDCTFDAVRVDELDPDKPLSASNPGEYDFVRCGLEPGDFSPDNVHPDSLIRVQRADGTAYAIDGDWNVTTIAPFAS